MNAVRRLLVGSRRSIGGTVYGTIVVMGAIAAGSHGDPDAWSLATVVSATVIVLWIAHVYAHALEETIRQGRRLDVTELVRVGGHELAIPLAAVGPVGALVLGALGIFSESTAVWLAMGLGVATLGLQGVRYARVETLGPLATCISIALNLSIGLLIVGLKAALGH